eukprot:Skav235701  [mRNA]  locus=scaffold280:289847:293241:- [translate_table: standard]
MAVYGSTVLIKSDVVLAVFPLPPRPKHSGFVESHRRGANVERHHRIMSMFKRFVEPGRLALITYGPCTGKLCTITDIVDQKRVVVDGPEEITGVRRHMMPIKRLSLTDFKFAARRGIREKECQGHRSEEEPEEVSEVDPKLAESCRCVGIVTPTWLKKIVQADSLAVGQ